MPPPTLSAGNFEIPAIGLGTMSQQGDVGLETMLTALELGYRHIDSAQVYGNEATVGQAIRESGLAREAVHVTTKINYDNIKGDNPPLRASLEESLEKFGMDQVDLTLIHWPGPPGAVPMVPYMEALARCREDGLTRHIGVSNFSAALIDEAVGILGPGVLRNNQVEVHSYLQNRKVRRTCASHGIVVTGYMPVAGGLVLKDNVIAAIAKRHGATPSQIAIAWLLAHGMVAIPSSRSRAHLKENLDAWRFALPASDIAEIDALDRGHRIIDPEPVAPAWDEETV